MTSLLLAFILLALSLVGVVLRKTYYALPLAELKRRAADHDHESARLYQAVAYGSSLRGLLWLYIAATSAAGVIVLARHLPLWLSLLLVMGVLWSAYSWLPASQPTRIGRRFTLLVTPFVAWVLNYFHPLLQRLTAIASRRYSRPVHTGMFERDDLLQLIAQQQAQPDSRLSSEELEIVRHVLTFPDMTVRDVLVARSQVRSVKPDDTIGPILLDELHQTNLDHVLVQDSPKSEIVGTLAVRGLGIHSSGRVRDIMEHTVYYVHESDSLSQALHAFFATNHPLFVVTNSFEEYVGVITVQTILKQLIGHVPGEDFDQYADRELVAARHPRPRRGKKTDDMPTEVIE